MQQRKQPSIYQPSSSQKMASSNPNNPNTKKIQKLKLTLIAMSVVFILSLISLILFFTLSSSRHHHPPPPQQPLNTNKNNDVIIKQACKATRDPSTCQSSLSQSTTIPSNANITQVILTSTSISSDNLKTGIKMIQNILDASSGNQNRSNAAKICLEVLHWSEYRTGMVSDAMGAGKIKDARAWMGAALGYQYDCWSGLKYVNGTETVDKAMIYFNDVLIVSSRDALGMMVNYDVYGGAKLEEWKGVKTERDGFFEPGSNVGGSGLGGVPTGLKPDVTVCKVGGCDYKTVQEGVNAGPDGLENGKRFVVWIKEGVYEETVRVPLEKRNVVFLGDGMGKTVITGSLNVGQPGMTTYNSATVGEFCFT